MARCCLLYKPVCASLFLLAPGAMAAAIAAAEATATVVLLSKDHIAFGRIIEIAGLQRLGRKGSKARVGRRHGRMVVRAAKLPREGKLKGSCLAARLPGSFR
jgi:hypothetical protein